MTLACFPLWCSPQRDALAAQQPAGKTAIRADEFKKFVAKLRIKSNDYKAKKQDVRVAR